MSQPKDTPWGPAEHAAHLGNGVLSVSTPRHGGLFIPDKVFCEIPAPVRETLFAGTASPGENWAEENCDLPIVMPFIFDRLDRELLDAEFPAHTLDKAHWSERARRTANHFERYRAVLPELERLERDQTPRQKHQK